MDKLNFMEMSKAQLVMHAQDRRIGFEHLLAELEALRAENTELRREIGELRMSRKMRGDEIESLRQQLAEAQNSRAKDALDAERYRWLRTCMPYSIYENLTNKLDAKSFNVDEKLDTAIDAAMNGEK